MQLPAHAHVEVVLNGFTITDWGKDDPPYRIVRPGDAIEVAYTQSGKMSGLSVPMLAGVLHLMLEPFSPASRWCLQREAERMRRIINRERPQTFAGTLINVVEGVQYALEGGTIKNIPPQNIANQTFEAVFEFEKATPNVDGGTFEPRFAVT